jgi:DtxR family transcriptional regulator, Mn-dependent transcriptional regulator
MSAARGRRSATVPAAAPAGRTVAASTDADVTGPVEDYLKAIYELARGGVAVATTALAAQLDVAPPSVTGMVRRLADQGLLTHEPYHGVRLTPQGRLFALRTLRRHRVIEAYLSEALGYGWDEVHEEAERLEHAASDDLIDRMAAAIGEPSVDPHGAPIPSRDGAVEEERLCRLADVKVGTAAEIMRISDDDPDLLRYLDDLGIKLGSTVRVVERAPYGGPITLKLGTAVRAIGPALAEQLFVRQRRR